MHETPRMVVVALCTVAFAGTAWADDAKPWQPKGATGVAVRTLAELAFSSVDWS